MSTPTLQQHASQPTLQPIDLAWVRAQFPSLKQAVNGQPAAFLDGPAGTQVPQRVIDAVRDYYEQSNANTCGAFVTSRRSDAIIASAHAAMGDFLNCAADEVFFGPNMTTITFALARAIANVIVVMLGPKKTSSAAQFRKSPIAAWAEAMIASERRLVTKAPQVLAFDCS